MQRVVERALRGRDEVELLQTEKVGDRGNVVRENVLPESHDAPDVAPPAGAPLRELELLHDLHQGAKTGGCYYRNGTVTVLQQHLVCTAAADKPSAEVRYDGDCE